MKSSVMVPREEEREGKNEGSWHESPEAPALSPASLPSPRAGVGWKAGSIGRLTGGGVRRAGEVAGVGASGGPGGGLVGRPGKLVSESGRKGNGDLLGVWG